MCDLIYDVITCCVWSCNTGKISVYDKIMIENQNKRERWKTKKFLHEFPSKRWFRNEIHCI